MRVTTEWLGEYVDLGAWAEGEAGARELAARLTAAGMNVEELAEVPGERGNFALAFDAPANRSDLLSLIGVAREIAALSGRPLRLPPLPPPEKTPAPPPVPVEVLAPELCPRYTARLIVNLTARPSPEWMRRRLAALGCSAINNLVDVTNYVMFETGQPLHAFDLTLLAGSRIVVRRARAGEKMRLLDGSQLALDAETLVIADEREPVALAGIMGGLNSGVREETQAVLLESAEFVPAKIRRARRRVGAPETESSRRFEHGVDSVGVELASRRAAALLAELGGGMVLPGLADLWPAPPAERRITLRPSRLARVLGQEVAPEEIAQLLSRLGFALLARAADGLRVGVPSHRRDVAREIDLIEEVARLRGYEKVPERIALAAVVPVVSRAESRTSRLRASLIALGADEVTSESLLAPELARAAGPWDDEAAAVLANPPRQGEGALRQSLLPSLLLVRRTNQEAAQKDCAFFEIGKVYVYRGPKNARENPQGRPEELPRLGLLDDAGLATLQGTIAAALARLGLPKRGLLPAVTFRPTEREYLARGRAAEVLAELPGADKPTVLGVVGEIAPAAAAACGLKNLTPAVAELDLAPLLSAEETPLRAAALPRFPAVERDVALVVDEARSWAEIRAVAAAAAAAAAAADAGAAVAPEVEALEFLSVFRGAQIGAGKKSVAFTLRYRSPERTLTDEEVARRHGAFLARVKQELGATVRGE